MLKLIHIASLTLILNNNNFQFNGNNYLQIFGTAMGQKMAPSYANIFMDKPETTLLSQAPSSPLYYARFIDDIFTIFNNNFINNKIHHGALRIHHLIY